MDSHPELEVPGWSLESLRRTVDEHLGLGDDAALLPQFRLLIAVASLYRLREGNREPSEDGRLGAFLLMPRAPEELVPLTKDVPILDNGQHPLTGRVWLVPEVAYSGRYLDLDDPDDPTLFETVGRLGLGSVPAVIVEPRTEPVSLRFYPRGLIERDFRVVFPLRPGEAVTLESVIEATDDLHQEVLITPSRQETAGRLWATDNAFPVTDAEAVVQMLLVTVLKVRYVRRGVKVRSELPTSSGRLDIQIDCVDPVSRKITTYVVIELKVLRSRRSKTTTVSENETRRWVKEGVEQAATYGPDRGALSSALFCFDMRTTDTGDSIFSHVVDYAAENGVALRRWYIYASDKAFRPTLLSQPTERPAPTSPH